MKRILYTLVATAISLATFAQSSQKMSYQAVIRNANNQLVDNKQIGLKLSILRGSASGTVVYTETQTPTTNANGLMSVQFGGGAGYSSINWAADTYFVKTEVDPTGGTNYTITGASQFLSVPFALYAVSAGNSSSDAAIAMAATSLTAETTRATAAEASLLTAVNAASAQLTALVAKADSVKASYDANVLVLNDSITNLNAQIASLTADKAQLQSSLTTAQATITQLNTQLAATTQANAASIASLKTQLTAANNKVTALTATLGTKDATITALTAQVADLNTALANAAAKAAADRASYQGTIDEYNQIQRVNLDPNNFDYTQYNFNYGYDSNPEFIGTAALAAYFKASVIAAYPIKGTILSGSTSTNEISIIGKAVKTKGAALTNAEITTILGSNIATTVHPLAGNTAALTTQIASLQAQKTADSTASIATIADLTTSITSLQAQKTADSIASKATITQLNTQLATTTQANAASIASLKTQLTAANNKVTALTATLGTKDATITALTAQVADLNTEVANLQTKNEEDKKALQQQINGLTSVIFINKNGAFTTDGSWQFGVNIRENYSSTSFDEDTTTVHLYRDAFNAAKAAGTYFDSYADVKAIALAIALNLINAGTATSTEFYTLYDKVTPGTLTSTTLKKSKIPVFVTAIAAARASKGADLTLDEVKTIIGNNNN